jgi:hypothetical protein
MTSPLYRELSGTVASDPAILGMLTRRRTGQQASYLFFGAVQDLLLSGAEHPLREFYSSVASGAVREPAGAGPALAEFCRAYHEELGERISTRLVQTNVVRRAIALRYALWAVGQRSREPVHLVEVGASAGMLLLVDRYRYAIGTHTFGSPDAAVTLDAEWRSEVPPPDLDDIPPIASRIGVDLNPVDVSSAEERRWLRALVWPEHRTAAALLDAALTELAADPPPLVAGDAIDVCPKLAGELPPGEPRVVFHAATRMHVPAERRTAFDDAIDSIGEEGPLYHVWLEPPYAPHHRYPADAGVLAMHGPDGDALLSLVRVDGHLQWLEPLG